MSCVEFRDVMVDLAREVRMEGREAALAHAASCPGCARRLAEQQRLTAALRALSASDEEAEAPAALEARLRRALRESASSTASPGRTRWGGWGWAGLATAAATLAAVSAWWRQPPPTPAPTPAHRAAEAAAEDPEDGSFLPVTYGDALAGADAVQVVRVRLPRAALGGMGLAVPGGPEQGAVEADVLVSQDGVTRGIRLVSATASR
jgi:hypothetical protein